MRVRGWRVKRSCGWSKRKEQEVVRDPVKVWFGQFFPEDGHEAGRLDPQGVSPGRKARPEAPISAKPVSGGTLGCNYLILGLSEGSRRGTWSGAFCPFLTKSAFLWA